MTKKPKETIKRNAINRIKRILIAPVMLGLIYLSNIAYRNIYLATITSSLIGIVKHMSAVNGGYI